MTLLEFIKIDPGNKIILKRKYSIDVDFINDHLVKLANTILLDDMFFIKNNFISVGSWIIPIAYRTSFYIDKRLNALCPVSDSDRIIANLMKDLVDVKLFWERVLCSLPLVIWAAFTLSYVYSYYVAAKIFLAMLTGMLLVGFIIILKLIFGYATRDVFLNWLIPINPITLILIGTSASSFQEHTARIMPSLFYPFLISFYVYPALFLFGVYNISKLAKTLNTLLSRSGIEFEDLPKL